MKLYTAEAPSHIIDSQKIYVLTIRPQQLPCYFLKTLNSNFPGCTRMSIIHLR